MHYSNLIADEVAEDMEDGLTDAGFLAGEATDRLLFENREWAVTDAGLEHKQTGYFIKREDLDKRRSDGLWTWPVHMLEKTWCTPRIFTEAFMRALLAYGVKPDPDLGASFLTAGRAQADRVAREFGQREPALEPIKLSELVKAAAEMCRRTGPARGASARIVAMRRSEPAERLRRHG